VTCNTCGTGYPIEQMTRKRRKPTPLCKPCAAAKSRQWRAKHPGQDYHTEPSYLRRRRHRAAHPDCAKTCCRNYRGSDYTLAYKARKQGQFVERVYRRVVWRRDGGICGICSDPCDPDNWHLDHIIPISRGGKHSYANVQPAHPTCNLRKWAHLPGDLAEHFGVHRK
jgi:5-methylcytosine-specific restriction endonuclease McrA